MIRPKALRKQELARKYEAKANIGEASEQGGTGTSNCETRYPGVPQTENKTARPTANR